MKIFLAQAYISSLKKIAKHNPQLLLKIKSKTKLFKENPNTPGLKLHKLTGARHNQWSFSVTDDIRILFIYENDGVVFIKIGKHEEVY